MKILIQRVLEAKVEIEEKIVGSIKQGALVFIGITEGDTKENAVWLANKFFSLRMFNDEHEKPNLSILESKGEVLIVSQFTLYADCMTGRRPSFSKAARPDLAETLYGEFILEVKRLGVFTQTGLFGAKMKVSLINDGPFTLMIEK